MKRTTSAIALATALSLSLAACSSGGDDATEPGGSGDSVTLQMAALEGGYGIELYEKAIEAFEAQHEGVTIELQASKAIEDEISPNMQAGRFPDLVLLGQGRAAGLTETLIKDNSVEDLTDVLGMSVPGEEVTVGEKITDGIIGSLGTNPYGDDKTYLMPLNYAPTGLVYDAGLFEEKGWEVPQTWDEFLALGETAEAEGISLFTYPTSGYMDSYFFSLFATIGGDDFFNAVTTYEEGVWQTEDAKEAIDLTTTLLTEYLAPTTVGYANEQDFTRNQQSILDNTAIFMPNGTWIVGEMADGPRADTFEWALTTVPAVEEGGQRYITTSIETIWIPTGAANKDLAKEFIAFLYSDEAAEIFAESGAIQPIQGSTELVPDELTGFYEVYDEEGVQALVGGFASTQPVEGASIQETLFNTADSIATGDKTAEQWLADLNTVSERLREASN